MADINLTVGLDMRRQEAERIARAFANELQDSTGQANRKAAQQFGKSFSDAIAEQDPKIARAFERSITAITRVDEVTRLLSVSRADLARVTKEASDLENDLDRVSKSGAATQRELAEATDRLSAKRLEQSRITSRVVSLEGQLTRAGKEHNSIMRQIVKAQDEVAADRGFGTAVLSIGKFVSAFRAIAVPVTGTLTAIVGAKTIASAAVLSQSLWMIPGAAAAAAAGIGSVSLATVGFGDAIKDIGDPEKFAAALQSLAPNAQQAALAIQSMMPQLTDLKNATQDAFFADGAEMLTTLANQYLPMVQQLTTGIAGAFNKAFQGIFDELMQPQTQSVVQSIVENLTAAFSRLADAAGPFSEAILNIINTGSSFLPQIANSAANAAQSFANFINTATQNGDLQRWFEDGIWAVGQLWDGIKALAKGFADLAPAGKRYLPEIVGLLENLAAILPPIITALGDMLPPIGSIKNAFTDMSNVAGGALNSLNQGLSPIAEILRVIKSLINDISNGLKGLTKLPGMALGIGSSLFGNNLLGSGNKFGAGLNPFRSFFSNGSSSGLGGGGGSAGLDSVAPYMGSVLGSAGSGGDNLFGSASTSGGLFSDSSTFDGGANTGNLTPGASGGDAVAGSSFAGGVGISGPATAGIAPPPAGGYPVPAPPPDKKNGGGGGKADEPPFTADPSTYSLDSIPIGGFFDGAGASGTAPAPMAVPTGPIVVPDITRAQSHIDAIAAMGEAFNLQNSSDVRNEPKSWHHTGNAVDLSNSSGPTPEMHAFAMYMAQNFGQFIEELIYSDPVRGDVLIGGGRVVGPGTDQPNYYDAATRAQHMNHVHIAVTEAMAPYLAAAMQQNMFAGAAGGGYMSVDQQAVAKAQTDLEQAYRTVEEKRLAYLKLQQSGDADQLQLLRAKNDVIQAEENYREREAALAEARMGKYRELDDGLTSAAARVTDSMGQIGAALADDFGLSEGLPGIAKWLTTFLANLAFAPAIGQMSAVSAMSPIKGGHGMFGMIGAQNMAAGRSPLGLSGGGFAPVAPAMGVGMTPIPGVGTGPLPGPAPYTTPAATTTTGLGFNPTGATPGAAAIGPAPLGGGVGAPMTGVPGTAGQGFFNSQAAASYLDQNAAAAGTPQTSRAPTPGTGGGFGGLGDIPMAAIGGAISAGSLALDAFAPGAGAIAGQAAQTGVQVANRTAAYVGQLGGILAGGLLETFLPNSSEAGDPSKSWIGRIASGIAGARPALPNTAGQSAPAQQPQQGQQQGQQQYGPMVKIDNLINNTPDSGQTLGRTLARQGMVANARGQR